MGAISSAQHADASVGTHRDESIPTLIKGKIKERFDGARIELTSPLSWQGEAPQTTSVESVNVLGESTPGVVQFSVTLKPSEAGESTTATGLVRFAAFVPAKVAVKRVLPGERLQANHFKSQEVDVATGMGREYRGIIVEAAQDLERLESRQTILEGQFLVSSAIRRVHDLRRGDPVRIELQGDSGLRVSLTGTAEESGYANESVHVITHRTKKSLIGKLRSDGLVEVQL